MEYLKTYENFQLGEDVWVIMDEDEKYMYADKISKGTFDVGNNPEQTFILIPVKNTTTESFRKYGYKTKKIAEEYADYMKRNSNRDYEIRIGFGTPDYENRGTFKQFRLRSKEMPSEYTRSFDFGQEEKLKAVKFFMGVVKGNENEDEYLNI